ncbi:hypothetical protein HFN51_03575 [Rhizobium leguminosarum]|nr:hypothetical protein [Rhizobium leguminosarum]
MAEILHFPRTAPPRPMLRLVCDVDDLVAAEVDAAGRKHVAEAMEHIGSADLELKAANVILLDRSGDIAELVSEEIVISLCHALISVIDAKGCRNDDRSLRNAAARAISDREGAHNGN